MVARSAVASLVMVAAALGWVACVGDDPESTTTPGNDGGGTDTGTAVDGNAPGTDAANDVDAGPERECDPTKPFGPKSPVSGILQGGAVARLSQDELTLYYDDFSGSFADAGQSDIVVAKRGKRSDSFGTPVSVGPINTAGREEHPTVTADGTTLFFVRVTGDTHIFFSTRTAGGLFESASEVPDIKAGDFDANPYVGPRATGSTSRATATAAGTSGEARALRTPEHSERRRRSPRSCHRVPAKVKAHPSSRPTSSPCTLHPIVKTSAAPARPTSTSRRARARH